MSKPRNITDDYTPPAGPVRSRVMCISVNFVTDEGWHVMVWRSGDGTMVGRYHHASPATLKRIVAAAEARGGR
jgi:hydroxymethylglutaryl-CoA reductase